MNFSEQLTRLRREKGLSQEALAELIGVSRQAVSKWEREEAQPDLTKIITLCDILDVSPDELLGYKTKESDEKKEVSSNSQKAIFWLVVGCMGFVVTAFCLGWSMAHPHIYNGITGIRGSLLGNDCMGALLLGVAAMFIGLVESYFEISGRGSFFRWFAKEFRWYLNELFKDGNVMK